MSNFDNKSGITSLQNQKKPKGQHLASILIEKFRNKFNVQLGKFGDLDFLDRMIVQEVNQLIQRGNLT